MTSSAICLVLAVAAYGTSALLLAEGSSAVDSLRDAVRQPAWILGTGFQGLGFLLAFWARHELSLLVVQSGVTASVAVTTAAGALLGRWAWSARDGVALALVVGGLALVGGTATTGTAEPLGVAPAIACTLAVLLVVALVATARGPLVLGAAAGLGYGASAVAARSLVSDLGALWSGVTWWAWGAVLLTVAGVVVGSAALTGALRGGHVAGPVSAMYVVATVASSAAGLGWLGDQVSHPVAAAAGVVLACGGSVLLAEHGAQGPEEAVTVARSSPT